MIHLKEMHSKDVDGKELYSVEAWYPEFAGNKICFGLKKDNNSPIYSIQSNICERVENKV